jgi:chloride channel 3/4/5
MCYFSTPDEDIRSHHRTSSIPPQIPLFTPNSPPLDFPFESVSSLDFGQYVDATPLAIHPHLPLETVMEMFKKLGPRVIIVELRGKVCGLVTVKDVLKYQFKVENQEHPRVERASGIEERLWGFIERSGIWISGLGFLGWFSRRNQRHGLNEGNSGVLLEDEVELVDRPR